MNKKLKLALFVLVILIIITVGYCFYLASNYKNEVSVQDLSSSTIISVPPEVINEVASSTETASSTQTVSYLISPDDTTKYCNGVDMNSAGYEKTITIEKSTSTPETNPTATQTIKTIIDAATTGMCNTVLNQLNITEDNGVVYIPQIEGWAGISIAMCSCKPQVEVNLLRIPGVTKVIWSTNTENVGNELEKTNFINIETPRPNEKISSPLTIKGQARGSWFFEASFPVFLVDWDGRIIAQGIASTKSDWTTTEFVPFESTLTFTADKNAYSNKGSLILKKDNPSGLPQNDDALEIPVVIGN